LVMVGGLATVKDAVLLVVPWPPLVELIMPVVLVYCPEAAPVTVTENVHEVETLPPDSPMVTGAVVVTVPPQPLAVPVATVKPVGRISVNATPVAATVLPEPLVIVKLNWVVAFTAMVAGVNNLAIVGGATTVRVASGLELLVAKFVDPLYAAWIEYEPAGVPAGSV